MGICYSSWKIHQTRARLKKSTFETVDVFEPPCGVCKVLSVYDADTCRVAIPMNDGTLAKFTVRLMGIDAPERKPSKQYNLKLFTKYSGSH